MATVLETPGNVTPTDWKSQYWQLVQSILQTVRQERTFPTELILPISGSGGVFEAGGSNESSGLAILPATPSGKPGWCLTVPKPIKNGPHALIKIWPDCLIGLGVHRSGTAQIAIYKVVEVERDDYRYFPEAGFGYVRLKFFTEPAGNHSNMYEPDPQAKTLPGVNRLMQAVKTKMFTFGCVRPMYAELLRIMDRTKAEEFFLAHVKDQPLADPEELNQDNSFQSTYRELIDSCAAARGHYRKVRVVGYWRPVPGTPADHPRPSMYCDYFVFVRKRDEDSCPYELYRWLPPMRLTEEGISEAHRAWASEYAHRLLPNMRQDKDGKVPAYCFYCFDYIGSHY